MLDSADFYERLSSAHPVPGGGSVAALTIAMAASLLVMVSNLTAERKRFVEVWERVERVRDQATALRDRATTLAEDDAAAYVAVSAAMKLPRGDEDERSSRSRAIQDALKGAATPPLESMRIAAEVLQLAGELVGIGNPAAVSDVGTAALAARAGFHAARLNVEINLAAVEDKAWSSGVSAMLSVYPDVDAMEQRIVSATQSIIKGQE
ncbi:MAG: cyclodeaminase/cyclohydrolase family protein [Chloroflexota bacterium]